MTLLIYSCKEKHNQVARENIDSLKKDSKEPFPQVEYDEIKILSLDSAYFDEGQNYFISSKLMVESKKSAGLTFLDSLGNPIHKKYHSRNLNDNQKKDLIGILKPTKGDNELTTDCFYIYRDAIVFYLKNKPIAFINVCFECEKTEFNPDSPYILDFDNMRFLALRKFFLKNNFKIKKSLSEY